MKKKKKNNKAASKRSNIVPNKNTKKSFFTRSWKLITGIAVLAGIVVAFITIKKEYLTSNKDKYEENYLVQGDLKPSKLVQQDGTQYSILDSPPIFTVLTKNDTLPVIKGLLLRNKKTSVVAFIFGNTVVIIGKDKLYKGVEFKIPILSNCYSSKISFGIKDDRVYVSVKFYDLAAENQIIGWIEYNHWNIYKPNMIDYPKSDDNRLEVRDKQLNIVFSIRYELVQGGNWIYVSGYFINPYSVSVLAFDSLPQKRIDTCIPKTDPGWREKATVLASSIKTIFP